MTLYLRAMLAALISAWLAITGLVLLGGWHLAVVEVLCLEVAAVALAVLALALEHPLDYAEGPPAPEYISRSAQPDGALLIAILAVDR